MDIGRVISRRSLLRSATASVCSAALAARPQSWGVQLYTLRELLLSNPRDLLKTVSEIGYREAEVLRRQIAPLAPYLKDSGLRPVSVHFETPLITGGWQAWKDTGMPETDEKLTFEQALAESKEHGYRYLVFNYLAPKERGELDFYRGLADKLNRAAEKTRAAGMQFCYHNHNFEFQPKNGGRPIDVLLERLDPKLIRLEVDAFWVSMSGNDPVAFIREHASRIEMIHLKDKAPGTASRFEIASVPKEAYVEVGSGSLDFPAILKAAEAANVKHYFVEQDYSPDPIRSLRQSYAALQKLS